MDSGALYVVTSGDTLWRIAEKAYGRRAKSIVDAIYAANTDRLKTRNDVSVGQRLVLPVIEGVGSPKAVTVKPSKPDAMELQRLLKQPKKPKYYDVKQGDRLTTIAERVLGNKERWREIHELNKDIFPDPGKIQYGVRIRIPETTLASAN